MIFFIHITQPNKTHLNSETGVKEGSVSVKWSSTVCFQFFKNFFSRIPRSCSPISNWFCLPLAFIFCSFFPRIVSFTSMWHTCCLPASLFFFLLPHTWVTEARLGKSLNKSTNGSTCYPFKSPYNTTHIKKVILKRHMHEVNYPKSKDGKLNIICPPLIILKWIPKWTNRMRPIPLFGTILGDAVFKAATSTSHNLSCFISLLSKNEAADLNTHFTES